MLAERDIGDIVDVVRNVGRHEILPRFRSLTCDEIETKTGPMDLVTVADRAAEDAIRIAVGKILPGATVVGEEAVAETPDLIDAISTSETCVIVDPIDGTGNYVAGIAVFGTILAVVHRGETVFGLLYDPVLDDWMFALRNEGAWFRRRDGGQTRLKTKPDCDLASSSGLVAFDDYAPDERADLVRGFETVRSVRDLRCSCHEYRLLASGSVDFLRSFTLKPWDHAAGILLLEEAGGWSAVDGKQRYLPDMHDGKIIAASCEAMGQRIATLAAGLP